ncbi:MAG: sugar phosphate isomerase/epimerase family protein [Acutalibacteraceae bacterium]
MDDIRIFAFADEASPMIDEQIKAMTDNGLDGLEMRNVDKVNVSDISDSKAREVRQKLDTAGLSVWSIGSPIGKIDMEKDDFLLHIEKFKRTLEIAAIVGASNIRLFSFFIPEGRNPADFKDEVIERLGILCDTAQGSGVTLCLENEKGVFGDTPERCLELFKALSRIRGVFDPANFVQCGADPVSAWDMLKDYIHYLHIKDARTDGNIVPAGAGDGCIAQILGEYAAGGGRCVTLEPHLAVFDGLAALEREGEKSAVGEITFESNEAAFKAGADALKLLLRRE